jgi:hypothetical protein
VRGTRVEVEEAPTSLKYQGLVHQVVEDVVDLFGSNFSLTLEDYFTQLDFLDEALDVAPGAAGRITPADVRRKRARLFTRFPRCWKCRQMLSSLPGGPVGTGIGPSQRSTALSDRRHSAQAVRSSRNGARGWIRRRCSSDAPGGGLGDEGAAVLRFTSG